MNPEDTEEHTATETVLVFIMCHSRKSLGNTQVKYRFRISMVILQPIGIHEICETLIQVTNNVVDVHSDENLTVHEISHMHRSSSIQSLNSDFVDAASDDSFQKEVPRLFVYD